MNASLEDQIAELVALASSQNFRDRVAAATRLTRFADVPSAHAWLRRLVLDDADTAVTDAAAHALTARGDNLALRVLAGALSEADDNQVNWIAEGVANALSTSAEVRDRASATFDRLLSGASAAEDPGVLRLAAPFSTARP